LNLTLLNFSFVLIE